jgi:phage terminase large subunit-like protein
MSAPECDSASIPRFCHPQLPVCTERGDHFCLPRAIRACAFFDTQLVHVKGAYARKPFILSDWQRNDIIGPIFGEVVHNGQRYVRQYRAGWIELGRKNGKSALLAGIGLYMLAFDGEEGSEVYGCAKDRDQARVIWDVASRMVQLSPTLSTRVGLRVRRNEHRIVDYRTGSYYAVLPRDALGNLGLDPYCVLFDEVIAQPDDQFWNAMRTAMGSRPEALMLAATTAGNDPSSFAAREHGECVRVADDPDRAPHRFVYIRNTPINADAFVEKNWHHANPALGTFLSIQTLRDEAAEARNDPSRENAFRQYRLNQWVSQATRWMPMHIWKEATGDIWPTPMWHPATFTGKEVWVGLDLSAKYDLTSLCIFVPPQGTEPGHLSWRHWIPEKALSGLEAATNNLASLWIRAGFLRVSEGSVIDYAALCKEIELELRPMKVLEVCYDKWSGEFVRQELQRLMGRGTRFVSNEPTFIGMTLPMRELMTQIVTKRVYHHADPVAMWCFDSVEVKRATDNPDLIKPHKPERAPHTRRIDAVISAALAVGAWRIRGVQPKRTGYGFS